MNALEVTGLCKSYPAFKLSDVSISLESGKITGFIGRNGAGKTTTLKSLFDFVHPDSGSVSFFGKDFSQNELEIKARTGLVLGGADFHKTKKLKKITAVTRSFYPTWDDAAYARYIKLFELDENKTPNQLSAGMRVKYSLALALSHRAELLILDEPTSGLDPVSRDELLEIFMNLCDEGVTILFSTHITSDLDACADNIVYIKDGRIVAEAPLREFVSRYVVAELESAPSPQIEALLVGKKRAKVGFSALVNAADAPRMGVSVRPANLDDIIIHLEKEDEPHA